MQLSLSSVPTEPSASPGLTSAAVLPDFSALPDTVPTAPGDGFAQLLAGISPTAPLSGGNGSNDAIGVGALGASPGPEPGSVAPTLSGPLACCGRFVASPGFQLPSPVMDPAIPAPAAPASSTASGQSAITDPAVLAAVQQLLNGAGLAGGITITRITVNSAALLPASAPAMRVSTGMPAPALRPSVPSSDDAEPATESTSTKKPLIADGSLQAIVAVLLTSGSATTALPTPTKSNPDPGIPSGGLEGQGSTAPGAASEFVTLGGARAARVFGETAAVAEDCTGRAAEPTPLTTTKLAAGGFADATMTPRPAFIQTLNRTLLSPPADAPAGSVPLDPPVGSLPSAPGVRNEPIPVTATNAPVLATPNSTSPPTVALSLPPTSAPVLPIVPTASSANIAPNIATAGEVAAYSSADLSLPENFAVTGQSMSAPANVALKPSVKSSLGASQKEVTQSDPTLGIGVAKPAATMSAGSTLAHPTVPDLTEVVGSVRTPDVRPETNSLLQQLSLTSTAHRAVEAVLTVTDRFSARDQHSVSLQFTVGGSDLNVRVELRAGEVRTTFRTDSPDLRAALASEWQSVTSQSHGDRSVRLASPVFISNDQAGASFSGDNASRQRNPEPQMPRQGSANLPRSGRNPGTTTSSTVTSPVTTRNLSANAVHLHTLA